MFNNEFFPTPRAVARKMLERITNKNPKHFLDPSAGKGDLADAIQERFGGRYRENITVDCIEIQPELVSVLSGKDHPVVGFDWLDYDGVCYYDAIIMNPPFSNGDEHLLRAWDFLHHGEIVCLLNEETIKNPHTAARKRLKAIIETGGSVEFLGDVFSKAQRKTGVNVALVYLKKESQDDSVDLWARHTEEKDTDKIDIGSDENMLALRDNLGNMQHWYDKTNEHMIQAFMHIRKAAVYMGANDTHDIPNLKEIIGMATSNMHDAKAEFLKAHRKSAWETVFYKMEFRKWLDKKQTDEFVRDIERNANIPFTKENIKGTLQNVFLQRHKLFEQSVANVFDELTRYYDGNTNHTEGWKSNDNYKVNKKIVFPWGCSFSSTLKDFSHRYNGSQSDIYNDLDRIMCVLDGKDFEKCDTIGNALDRQFRKLGYNVKAPFDNEVESDYFRIKFYKKGTVHLFFKDDELWTQFNVTASKGKMWLGHDTKNAA